MAARPRGVLIADSSRLFAENLARRLSSESIESRIELDVASALCSLARAPAELTLLDRRLADGTPAQQVTSLLEAGSMSVIILAPMIEEADLLQSLEAGALGYVSRDEPAERLVYDIKGALRGEACLPRDRLASVLRLLIDRRRVEDQRAELLRSLSKRETEVLQFLMAGAGNEEIAAALFLSPATIRTHIQNLMSKLNVHSRLEAIALANEHGLTPASIDLSLES